VTDACTNSCTSARCGDGVTRAGVEQCDDGNSDTTDACTSARCGDGVTRAGISSLTASAEFSAIRRS
jgi:cysteine-rich repeat protein